VAKQLFYISFFFALSFFFLLLNILLDDGFFGMKSIIKEISYGGRLLPIQEEKKVRRILMEILYEKFDDISNYGFFRVLKFIT
jgi:hypothetical protein